MRIERRRLAPLRPQVAERKFNYAHDKAVAAIFDRPDPQQQSLWEHLLELRESMKHELGMARRANEGRLLAIFFCMHVSAPKSRPQRLLAYTERRAPAGGCLARLSLP